MMNRTNLFLLHCLGMLLCTSIYAADRPVASEQVVQNSASEGTLEECQSRPENQNTPGTAGCYEQEVARLDAKLESMIKPTDEHRQELKDFGATNQRIQEIEKLKADAHKIWKQYRKAYCAAVYEQSIVYGIGAPTEFSMCRVQLTKHRIAELLGQD